MNRPHRRARALASPAKTHAVTSKVVADHHGRGIQFQPSTGEARPPVQLSAVVADLAADAQELEKLASIIAQVAGTPVASPATPEPPPGVGGALMLTHLRLRGAIDTLAPAVKVLHGGDKSEKRG